MYMFHTDLYICVKLIRKIYVSHDSYICVTRKHVSHEFVYMCVTNKKKICDGRKIYVSHDSYICVTRKHVSHDQHTATHTSTPTDPRVTRALCVRETCAVCVCERDMLHANESCQTTSPHVTVRMCEKCPIFMCHM